MYIHLLEKKHKEYALRKSHTTRILSLNYFTLCYLYDCELNRYIDKTSFRIFTLIRLYRFLPELITVLNPATYPIDDMLFQHFPAQTHHWLRFSSPLSLALVRSYKMEFSLSLTRSRMVLRSDIMISTGL